MVRPASARGAARRPVNLSIDVDLLTEARLLTHNLSATVETLLGDYVRAERVRREGEQRELDSVIDKLNALHAEHGYLSDEFTTL